MHGVNKLMNCIFADFPLMSLVIAIYAYRCYGLIFLLLLCWITSAPGDHSNFLCLTPHFLLLQAFQVKNNISRFSGFVWHENEVKGE